MTDPLHPEPVAWFRAPYGTLEPNPLFRATGPQSLEWVVPCYTEYHLREYAEALAASRVERAVAAERERWEKLAALLKRCRPIIEADAQMMADISRHAPLDADSQAKHDATEYESEKLARELERLLGPNSLSQNQPPATGK